MRTCSGVDGIIAAFTVEEYEKLEGRAEVVRE